MSSTLNPSPHGLCTKNRPWALIERPYSCETQPVGAVYDRPTLLGRRALVLLLLLTLASCSVGPKYKRPPAPVPPAFKEVAGWKQAQPQDDVLREKWWEIYGDAELNALQEQVDVSNQTISAVEAQFRTARAAIGVVRSGLFPELNGGATVLSSRTIGSNQVSYVLPLQL